MASLDNGNKAQIRKLLQIFNGTKLSPLTIHDYEGISNTDLCVLTVWWLPPTLPQRPMAHRHAEVSLHASCKPQLPFPVEVFVTIM